VDNSKLFQQKSDDSFQKINQLKNDNSNLYQLQSENNFKLSETGTNDRFGQTSDPIPNKTDQELSFKDSDSKSNSTSIKNSNEIEKKGNRPRYNRNNMKRKSVGYEKSKMLDETEIKDNEWKISGKKDNIVEGFEKINKSGEKKKDELNENDEFQDSNNKNQEDDEKDDSGRQAMKGRINQGLHRTRTRPVFSNDQLNEIFCRENPKSIYIKSHRLGKGAYGSVFIGKIKGIEHKHEKVAIKICQFKDENALYNLANEIKLLEICKHENIVKHIKSYLVKEKEIWTIMEYCNGGSLAQMLKIKIEEVDVSYITKCISQGLSYLHQHHVVHRDIKSENILLNIDGSVRIGDLGLSTTVESGDKSKYTFAGSRYWMAPEIFRGTGYGRPVDIWSLGCVLMEMMRGTPPYHRVHPLKAMFLVSTKGRDQLTPEEEKTYSPELLEFLDHCLVFNPDLRSTGPKLLELDFIKKNLRKFVLKEFAQTLNMAFMVRVTEGLDY